MEEDNAAFLDGGIVVKLEPAWAMEEDSPNQPSAVYSTAQPMSDNTSLLSLDSKQPCYLCSAAFVLVSSLELHLASVHGEKLPYSEWTQSYESTTLYSILGNSDREKKQEPAWSDDASGSPLSLNIGHLCHLCSTAFALVSRLELHLASVHGEKLHVISPESCSPERVDTDHTDIDERLGRDTLKNKGSNIAYSGKNRERKKRNVQHVCEVCHKAFPRAFSLARHRAMHSANQRPFACELCGKQFTQAVSLRKHKRIHVNPKRYPCDVCDAVFERYNALKAHKPVHNAPRAYVCEICHKTFAHSGDLPRHRRIHTGERPFKCPHCDADFVRAGNLQSHVSAVHAGQRPHVCDICGAAFAQMGNLTVHRRKHTGEKPFVCDECGKGFASSSCLTSHRMTHTGEKRHVCPHCPAAFVWSKYLKKHLLTAHL